MTIDDQNQHPPSGMRFNKKRILFFLFCLSVGGVLYSSIELFGGRSTLHALKDAVLLKDSSVARHEFVINHNAHVHNEEIPFVLRDESARTRPPVEKLPSYNISRRRMGYEAQLGNDLAQTLNLPDDERTIAVGCAITTRGQWEPQFEPERLAEILPFFKGLLSSFCRTASYGFDYHFYVAHDHEDPFFIRNTSHHYFKQTFYGEVMRACPHAINVSLHMVECHHSGTLCVFLKRPSQCYAASQKFQFNL